jgi:CHAD domain-containing protein
MNLIDPQLLIKELDVTYRLVSDIYIACRNKPNPESLHKFRKKAKDFLYQLYVFKPLNPTTIKAVEKKLDSMTQNLGKYNDIAQIIKMLDYNHKDVSNPAALNELVIKFYDAQDYYLSKVWPSAYQIFCPGQKLVNVLGFKLLII